MIENFNECIQLLNVYGLVIDYLFTLIVIICGFYGLIIQILKILRLFL